MTASSVLLVATFHASFDAAINQLSYDVVPASNTARFLIFSAVIVLAAKIVIIATRGQLGRQSSICCRIWLTDPRTAVPIREHRVDRLLAS
jgi:hypothetical protein